jgi:ABC-type transport system involved in cytochrome c biogenesis permease subunit
MSWISGVSILCFAASYLVAFGLEVSRLVFRSRLRRPVRLVFAGAGLFAQTLFLVYRGQQVGTLPLSSLYDWLLVLSWLLVVFYLYLALRHSDLALGVFLLPVVLGLVGTAWWLVDRSPRSLPDVIAFWGMVHGGLLAFGTVAVIAAFVAGLMYLVQGHRLKAKHRPARGLRLPSLERLEAFNRQSITLAFPLLTLGLMLGLGLAVYQRRVDAAVVLHDPKVVSTLVTWFLFAVLLHARYRPELRGRKIAYLTIVAFGFLLFTLVGVQLLPVESWHGPGLSAAAPGRGPS